MEFQLILYNSPEYCSMCALRDEILRKPIGLRLTDDDKQKDTHDTLFACLENNTVIACCIFSALDKDTGKLRQMAVDRHSQGQSIGKKTLRFAEQWAIQQAYTKLTMHARKSAIGFYEKEGYRICSDEFTEVGIPHYKMEKIIQHIMNLEKIVRKNIWALKPYSSARDEFQGKASVYLDANESPYNTPYNRYPDPKQWQLKEKIAPLKEIRKEQILLGNGSDEPIDLSVRIFCEPGIDNVLTLNPTYGMYRVAAQTNNVEYRELELDRHFDFKAENLLKMVDEHTKLIFLCSPNNPTGNSLNREEILKTIRQFQGIVIIDEAYIDFSSHTSFLTELDIYPNLIVLQTFSKAWASAGVRLGMAYASEQIINLFNKVKYPYNINILTLNYAIRLLEDYHPITEWVNSLLSEKNRMQQVLLTLACVEKVYPSDANFLLVKVTNANAIYQYLIDCGIVVRNRNNVSLCLNCIRISIGTQEENSTLVECMKKMHQV